jgi:hypothetical protein
LQRTVEPEPQRDADGVRARAKKRDGAVDAAAHRDGHAAGGRSSAKDGTDRVRERIDRERLAADPRRLEERQPCRRPLEPGRVRLDDPVAVDREANERELAAARGVSEDLDHCRSG